MLKKEDLAYGDIVRCSMVCDSYLAKVGTRFRTWCEIQAIGDNYYHRGQYKHLTLLPICRTEMYKALTGDSHDV